MKWIFTALAIGLAFSGEQACADNFRCPNENIVSTGDSISTVASKCDAPAFMFKREEPMTIEDNRTDSKSGTRIIYIEVQEWTYNQGLSHTLIFRNGIFSEIRFGGFAK
jgi:hypothetical protein